MLLKSTQHEYIDNKAPPKKLSPFETVFAIFKIINNGKIETYTEELDILFKELESSDFNFFGLVIKPSLNIQ